MFTEKLSANSIATEISTKLRDIGGQCKLETQIHNIRSALGWWFPSAPGRIKRYIHREQRPTADDVDAIRRAHAKACIRKYAEHSAEAQRYIAELERFIAWARQTDPTFYFQDIAQALSQVRSLGNAAGRPWDKDGE